MISGYLDLLLRRHGGQLNEEAQRFTSSAIDGAVRMRELIEALLAYSRISSRGQPFASVDLVDVVEEAWHGMGRALEDAGGVLHRRSLAGRIWADRAQIVTLFRHLFSNALKFQEPTRPLRIEIGTERVGEHIIITVADNGIGIDPNFTERIFMVFGRLHTRTEYPGTGIGLALCKRIAERHGGRIELDPVPIEGACFRTTLPADGGNAHV